MDPREQKYWIAVACKSHVENGVKLGIAQFCHGKSTPANRPYQGDIIIYYSSKLIMNEAKPCQKFTAIGEFTDEKSYRVSLENGFQPFRRNVHYYPSREVAIQDLIPSLDFIKNKKSWGYAFRFGFLEIDINSYKTIASAMLAN